MICGQSRRSSSVVYLVVVSVGGGVCRVSIGMSIATIGTSIGTRVSTSTVGIGVGTTVVAGVGSGGGVGGVSAVGWVSGLNNWGVGAVGGNGWGNKAWFWVGSGDSQKGGKNKL